MRQQKKRNRLYQLILGYEIIVRFERSYSCVQGSPDDGENLANIID